MTASFNVGARRTWLCLTSGTVMPGDWLLTVLRFRVDENTFAEFAREVHEDTKATL